MVLGSTRDDPLQHVGEPGERVDAVQFAGLDQGVCNGPTAGSGVAAGE
jgi:hypothetical protein